MQRQEGGRETRAEGRGRLAYPRLGPGDLGRVAGQEMIQSLLGRQAAHGRHDAEGIASQKDDVSRMAATAGQLAVIDEIDGVCRSGIFGETVVRVIGLARVRVDDDVFQDATKADRIPNLWLAL